MNSVLHPRAEKSATLAVHRGALFLVGRILDFDLMVPIFSVLLFGEFKIDQIFVIFLYLLNNCLATLYL